MKAHVETNEERFSFAPFTRHAFFTDVNRWIVERVVSPGRGTIVDLGCGPGAVTQLIVDRLGQRGDARVIGVDPSPSALEKARMAITSRVAEFVEGSAEWSPTRTGGTDWTDEQIRDRDPKTKKGPKLPGVGLAQWTTKVVGPIQ